MIKTMEVEPMLPSSKTAFGIFYNPQITNFAPRSSDKPEIFRVPAILADFEFKL